MKTPLILGLVAATALWMTGCGSSTPAPEEEAMAEPGVMAEVATEMAGEEMTVELGCGGCIYKMEGVTSCVTAAKVGDVAMLVEGGEVDAHEAGLCEEARMATVVGEVTDGTLHASSITLL